MVLTISFKSVHPIDYYIVGGNIPQSTDFYRNTFSLVCVLLCLVEGSHFLNTTKVHTFFELPKFIAHFFL